MVNQRRHFAWACAVLLVFSWTILAPSQGVAASTVGLPPLLTSELTSCRGEFEAMLQQDLRSAKAGAAESCTAKPSADERERCTEFKQWQVKIERYKNPIQYAFDHNRDKPHSPGMVKAFEDASNYFEDDESRKSYAERIVESVEDPGFEAIFCNGCAGDPVDTQAQKCVNRIWVSKYNQVNIAANRVRLPGSPKPKVVSLAFQTIQVPQDIRAARLSRPETKNPAANEGAIAGIRLLAKAAQALNGWAVAQRTNSELESLKPKIEAVMPRDGGVLICVGIQQWATPDPTGATAESFLFANVCGSGNDAAGTVQKYLSEPQLTQGAASGWKVNTIFLWATASGS